MTITMRRIANTATIIGMAYLFVFGLDSDSKYVLIHCIISMTILTSGFVLQIVSEENKKQP